jgi:hypothetical protein
MSTTPVDVKFGPFSSVDEVEMAGLWIAAMARDEYYAKWTSIGYKVELHINETMDDRGRRCWFVVGKRYSPEIG